MKAEDVMVGKLYTRLYDHPLYESAALAVDISYFPIGKRPEPCGSLHAGVPFLVIEKRASREGLLVVWAVSGRGGIGWANVDPSLMEPWDGSVNTSC